MSYFLIPMLLLSAIIILAVPPRASRSLRRARLIVAWALLHPIFAAILLGCDYFSATYCGMDLRGAFGLGWIIWGWVPMGIVIGLLECVWRIIYIRSLVSYRKAVGDDPALNWATAVGIAVTLGLFIAFMVLIEIGVQMH